MTFTRGVEYPHNKSSTENHWYISPSIESMEFEVVKIIVIWNSLYNFIIPIATYCRIEIQKFIGSKFVAWDLELRDDTGTKPPIVKTSDINEELGQTWV